MSIHPIQMTDESMKRLELAQKTKKWGHLETWRELYIFQRTIASPQQIQDIAKIARLQNDYKKGKYTGMKITLPYMNMVRDQKTSGADEKK